ncbi:hypothetical protein OPKNFCMD_4522 [Methylobacterium crusticola]|uniref:DUF3102 domain-containing protein n=1 Tax=Methylobacterium crusticola TaxID=1697972 RepID=A0ABQ4R2S9_9HYPH|nr:DUF3102 domain-containing protein [Methylobacterium crusticola]GJD51764.1 hypothetical protein OPKNFCMD_4522 [Methylobacterium crusticola]
MSTSNIATSINEAHAKVQAAARAAVEHATECGRLLNQAKETVLHGKWDEWVREHCTFSARSAQLYMRLARYLEDDADQAKTKRVADLSLREVGKLLSKPAFSQRKPLPPEGEKWLKDFGELWQEGRPEAKEMFARWLYNTGQVNLEQRDNIILAAWHNPDLTEADRAAAAKELAELFHRYLPPEALKITIQGIKQHGPQRLFIAMGDVIEARRGKA